MFFLQWKCVPCGWSVLRRGCTAMRMKQFKAEKASVFSALAFSDFGVSRIYLTQVCGLCLQAFGMTDARAAVTDARGVSFLTEKDLKKLNRYQLLELLIAQTERADHLQTQLEGVQRQLDDRNLQLASLGSIAEASLQLSGVFQAAQEAADLYLNAAKQRAEEIVAQAEEQARQMYYL